MKSSLQKIGFVSLGCPKNLVDNEVMMGQLQKHGYELTTDREQADVMVVNTCGFIQSAKEESINTILEMAELKDSANLKRLVVAGCLVERYRQDLLTQLPEVDAVLGTSEIEKIVAAVDPAAAAAQDAAFVASNAWMTRGLPTYLYDENAPRVLATQKHFAYVKIAEGCDHTCAFCAIPQMRGNYRSRRAGSIINEARQLAEQGVKELVLISQDSTQYGLDLGLKDGLADLLKGLQEVDGVEWIRIMYTYPNSLSDATLEAMGSLSKVCKYLDMPLQHASASVLKRIGDAHISPPDGFTIHPKLKPLQDAGMTIGHIENFKLHYAETLRYWKQNVDRNRRQIRALGMDEGAVRVAARVAFVRDHDLSHEGLDAAREVGDLVRWDGGDAHEVLGGGRMVARAGLSRDRRSSPSSGSLLGCYCRTIASTTAG